ncbi:TetR/AcrR family transcriptional regulator [Nocardioides ginsengisoli]
MLATTLEMIASEGLSKVTIASLAARLETSGGHLLYYFGTRNGLLLETLRWSEAKYTEQRAPLVDDPGGDLGTVLAFAEIFLPVDERDPRWLLWLELWARAPYDAELAAAQRELDDGWHHDLVTVLRRCLPSVTDPEGVSEQLRAMWDGFAIQIVNGGGTALRKIAVERHTRAVLERA